MVSENEVGNSTRKDDDRVLSRTKRLILLIIVLVFPMFSFYKLILVDRMGFCHREAHFVSDETILMNVLRGMMESGRMKLDSTDTTPKAYLAHHPNCCRVDRGGSSLFGRGLFNFASVEVTVVYEMSEQDIKNNGWKSADEFRRSGSKETFYEFVANVTNCEDMVGYTGISVTPPTEDKHSINK